MPNSSLSTQSSDDKQQALLRMLKATTKLSAQATFYAAALGAILLIPGAQLPAVLATLAGGVGVNALSSVLERVAKGEKVSDDEIRQQVQAAIDDSNIANLLTTAEFQEAMAKLQSWQELFKYTVFRAEETILERMVEQSQQYTILINDMRDSMIVEFEQLATKEQSEKIIALLQQLLNIMPPPSPGSAPPLPNLIVGRGDDLAALEQRLTGEIETTLLTAVRGWPGIGKTTLAAALAHDDKLKEAFSDGVLWIALGQEPGIHLGLGDWLAALGEEPRSYPTPEARSQRLAALLRQKKMLLIIDDVWEAADAQPFLVGGSNCRTLITTREPKVARDLGLPEQAIYKLLVLSEEASLELLSKIAPSVVDSEPEGVKTLVNELEGLPLALHVAGRLLVEEAELGLGVSDLLAELAEGVRILEEQAPADRTDLATQTTPTVAALFRHSTDRLDEETQERFALLGIFVPKPATFDAPAIAAAWGVDDPRLTLRTLLARGLIEPAPGSRFQMHALLAVHAKSMWETQE